MPKDISWSRIAGWILLGLEALWALLFLAFVFVFQFAGATEAVRLGLILTAFHAGAPLALILALERTGEEEPQHHHSVRLTLAHGFWIVFAVVTDLWSVFHAFLTLAEADNIYQSALRALTVLAIVMSSLTAIWYFVMYGLQRRVSHNKKKSILHEVVEEAEGDIEEAGLDSMRAPLRRKIVHQPNKF